MKLCYNHLELNKFMGNYSEYYEGVGEAVFYIAKELFKECGAEEDFCVQDDLIGRIVFGGTNRVIWSAATGFRMDESYCTERFKKLFPDALEDLKYL